MGPWMHPNVCPTNSALVNPHIFVHGTFACTTLYGGSNSVTTTALSFTATASSNVRGIQSAISSGHREYVGESPCRSLVPPYRVWSCSDSNSMSFAGAPTHRGVSLH